MSGPPTSERETRAAREVTARAIRRLDVLQGLLLAGTAALAVGGGAVVAWLLSGQAAFAFRPTWMAASVVILVVTGAISLVRMLRERRRPDRASRARTEPKDAPREHRHPTAVARPRAMERVPATEHPPTEDRGDGDG